MTDKTNDKSTRRLVVLGGGESGVGAAILGKSLGWDVLLSDAGTLKGRYRQALEQRGIAYEEGGHSPGVLRGAHEVVKSPGIPLDAPLVVEARAAGIPVISEIELAGRHARGSKMVCVTGSNGKTTTTMLIHHILTAAGIDASLAGNIGRSLAWQVAEEPHQVYVVELSSFQLDNMYDFKADIAVMMNITPDHLDRYGHCMQNYVNAKFRILQNMTMADAFIYWADDPVIQRQLQRVTTEARQYPFAQEQERGVAAWVDAATGNMVIRTPGTSLEMPRAELSLPGLHNLFNSMAAGLSACLMEVRSEVVRKALSDFQGVEHRLQGVGVTAPGVRWVNDSKATNVNSTWYALESMPEPAAAAGPSVILILGGKDKGNDYSEILPLVRRKVRKIVAMGLHNEKIVEFFGQGAVPGGVADTHSLAEALEACRREARRGDTVLLSPCCASFDLFTSYEDRGRQFAQAVAQMGAQAPQTKE